jgi:hypothetical protein
MAVEQAIANPSAMFWLHLDAQVPARMAQPHSYSFVGGADHAVSCLNYGSNRQRCGIEA